MKKSVLASLKRDIPRSPIPIFPTPCFATLDRKVAFRLLFKKMLFGDQSDVGASTSTNGSTQTGTKTIVVLQFCAQNSAGLLGPMVQFEFLSS